jgi:hypothetical protein
MKKIKVDRSAVFGTAAGVVTGDKGALRPDRATTVKVAVKVGPAK